MNITKNITLGNYPINPWQLIDEDVINNQNESNFTRGIDGNFSLYKLILIGIQASANHSVPYLRVSENKGTSWSSGADNYAWNVQLYNGYAGDDLDSQMVLTQSIYPVSNATGDVLNYELTLFDPSSFNRKAFLGTGTYLYADGGVGVIPNTVFSGVYRSPNPINGVQFFFNNSIISNGTIQLYGLRK